MKIKVLGLLVGVLAMGALIMGCFQVTGPALSNQGAPARAMGQPGGPGGGSGGGGGDDGEDGNETAVNNLSFPVLWAEADDTMAIGVQQAGITSLTGTWVYWAGLDNDENPIVYPSNTDDPDPDWKIAFLQQDGGNVWTADAKSWTEDLGGIAPLVVDLIDWGDNLESVDWTTTSKVRTEVVLYKNLPDENLPNVTSLNGYEMLHVIGLGVDEMHGLSVAQDTTGEGTSDAERAILLDPVSQPIVYTNHARLTIQKLNFDRGGPEADQLTWYRPDLDAPYDPDDLPRWVSVDADNNDLGLVDAPLFNETVYDDVTGPGGYSAEINIKGRVVYGYTWDTRATGAEEGDYRLTFSLDSTSGAAFDEGTDILETSEEVVEALAAEEEPDTGGGSADVVPNENLTYIDIHLRARGGGGGGGQGKGGGTGGGGGKGKGGGGGHASGDDA